MSDRNEKHVVEMIAERLAAYPGVAVEDVVGVLLPALEKHVMARMLDDGSLVTALTAAASRIARAMAADFAAEVVRSSVVPFIRETMKLDAVEAARLRPDPEKRKAIGNVRLTDAYRILHLAGSARLVPHSVKEQVEAAPKFRGRREASEANIVAAIREKMTARKLTPAALAKLCPSVARQTIYNLLDGKPVKSDTMLVVMNALDIGIA